MHDDKILICRECGASFTFTAGEQEFYDRKGFQGSPSRCPDCRKTGSGSRRSGEYGMDRNHSGPQRPEQLFLAACAQCGQDTQVSARLILGDGTIYCPECIPLQPEAAARSTGGWRESW